MIGMATILRRTASRLLYAILLIAAAGSAPASALDEIRLSKDTPSAELARSARYCLDRSGKLGYADIAAGKAAFTPYSRNSFQFSFMKGTLWIESHIRPMRNSTGMPGTYLVFDNVSIASIVLYVPVKEQGLPGVRVMKGGWRNAGQSAQERFLYPSFRLPVDYDDSRPLLISVDTPYSLQFRATLSLREVYNDSGFVLFLIIGFCAGILVSMSLYNLFLFYSVRERQYLYYVLYVLVQLVYQCMLFGIIPYLWPQAGRILASNVAVLSSLMMISAIFFTISFLDTRHTAPKHDIVMKTLAAVMVIVMLMVFADLKWIANIAAYMIAQAAIIATLTASLASMRYGFRPARYFLAARAALMISGTVFIFRFYGLLPNNSFTLHALFFGTAAESVLLSFALGYRIRVMKEEGMALREREKSLRMISITDDLTRLYNKRYFNLSIEEQMLNAQRKALPLSLFMLDVDHFKRFNDTYGHPEGDRVLASLGFVIRTSLREEDVPCRYGGEEFAVILHNTDEKTATVIAERIRERFGGTMQEPAPDVRMTMTVSIGITCYQSGESAQDLVKRCDRALYRAKSSGRNRVVAG